MPFCLRCGRTSFRELDDWMVFYKVGRNGISVSERQMLHAFSVSYGEKTYMGGLCPDCVIPDDRLRNTPKGQQLLRYRNAANSQMS